MKPAEVQAAAPPLVRSQERGPRSLRLRLAARREALEPARLAVLDFLADQPLGSDTVFRLELVLEEVLMNIAWHAYPPGSDSDMGLDIALTDDRLELLFTDEGQPFDPTQAAPAPQANTVGDAVPGGLGLVLLKRYSTSLGYRRDGQRNELRVTLARH